MCGPCQRTQYTSIVLPILLAVILVGSGPALAQGPSAPGNAEEQRNGTLLDRITFGSNASEKQHDVQGKNTGVFSGPAEEWKYSGVHITATTATSGSAPQNTLKKGGEWSGSKGEWIQYELSEVITLDEIEITWAASRNNYLFRVLTSKDGEDWTEVTSERSGGSRETYEFDPVEARYVRIHAGGADRWWRPQVFRVKQVRIGDLEASEAYQKPLMYNPAPNHRARRLAAGQEQEGSARLAFTMITDPDRKNYFTLKFWGSEWRFSKLRLADAEGNYIDGAAPAWKPVYGYGARGMGALWEFGGTHPNGPFPGRFIYATFPLPRSRTEGKESSRLQLVKEEGTSHGIYAAYTHTDPFFVPPSDEQQGQPVKWGSNRPKRHTHNERIDILKARARKLINQVMSSRPTPTGQKGARRIKSLSEAYNAEWSDHHRDPKIVDIVRNAIDHAVRNDVIKGWHYNGLLARSFTEVLDGFKKQGYLSEAMDHDGDPDTEPVPRHRAYATFFHDAFEWRKQEKGGRREVSNQTMAVSANLFRLQEALQVLQSDLALPEKKADRYMQEALGMKPFYAPYPRRDWVRKATEAGYPFYIISEEGLAKEGGHASHYGELAVTRAGLYAEELGTKAARRRAAELIRARAITYRRPSNDGAGYAALRGEPTFTYRGRGYPGGINYVKHGMVFMNAAILEDPVSLRIAELYMKQGHFDNAARQGRVVRRVEDYLEVHELLKQRDPDPLPLEPDHPDFGWGDEDVGVFAIKHGNRTIHGSFVLTMPGAVVPIARIHYTTPRLDRLADVMTRTALPNTGEHLSLANGDGILGQPKFPRTPPPPGLDVVDQWRKQDIRASMAYFYQVKFGDYMIAMNTTKKGSYRENTFTLDIPDEVTANQATDLVSGRKVNLKTTVSVPPDTTVILYLGD